MIFAPRLVRMDRRPVLLHALERGHRSRSRRSCRHVGRGHPGEGVPGLAGLGRRGTRAALGIFVLGFIAFLLWLVWILVISFFLFQPREQAASTPKTSGGARPAAGNLRLRPVRAGCAAAAEGRDETGMWVGRAPAPLAARGL